MGENNSFLLTRDIITKSYSTILGRDVNTEMVYEWTKYKFSPYTTMDQFYASLIAG